MSYTCRFTVNVEGREFKLSASNVTLEGLQSSLCQVIDYCHHIANELDVSQFPPKKDAFSATPKAKPAAAKDFEAKAVAAANEASRTASHSAEFVCDGCQRSVFSRTYPVGWVEKDGKNSCNECQFIERRTGSAGLTCFGCGERSTDLVDDECPECRGENSQ